MSERDGDGQLWYVRAMGLISPGQLDSFRHRAAGFDRLICNRGTEGEMRDYFERLVAGGFPLAELAAPRRGVVRRHDDLIATLAAAPDPEAPDEATLRRLGVALLYPAFLREQ